MTTDDVENINKSTLKFGLCMGCGICQAVCPFGALTVRWSGRGQYLASIDEGRCQQCGTCVDFCPFTLNKLTHEAKKISAHRDPEGYGVENCSCYIVCDKDEKKRIRSASGGFISAFLTSQLKNRTIQAVLHGTSLLAHRREVHYGAILSHTIKEIDNNRSSFYTPLNFFEPLTRIRKTRPSSIAIVATPCMIRGFRYLFTRHPEFSKSRALFISLVCSHCVNHEFFDFLAGSVGLDKKDSFICNARVKTGAVDAHNYSIRFSSADRELVRVNRFESLHTRIWRNYFFAMRPCHFCADFWGYDGDISAKDAWGRWAADPRGTSLVVLRTAALEKQLLTDSTLQIERIDSDTARNNQIATAIYKQRGAIHRLNRSLFHPDNIRSGFLRYWFFARASKTLFRRFGFRFTRFTLLPIQQWLAGSRSLLLQLKAGSRKLMKILLFPIYPIIWFRRYFRFSGTSGFSQILVLGGYGYRNVGDEAQLNASLQLLEKEFPREYIKILTPNLEYTHMEHACPVGEAPRLAFFNADRTDLYQLKNLWQKTKFVMLSKWIYMNALGLRMGLKPLLINARKNALLYDLLRAKLVYFSGGGYLTGDTLSRLWDGLLVMRIAKVFKVPVILSGQTVGLWNSRFTRNYAFRALNGTSLIGLRDATGSSAALKEIGVNKPSIIVTHDDALFCDKAKNSAEIRNVLQRSGIEKRDLEEGYMVLHLHFWGVTENSEKMDLLRKIRTVVDLIHRETGKKILLVSMTPTDEEAIRSFSGHHPHPHTRILPFIYDFRMIRAVIAGAAMCVSMKHHPLIFALGERVPIISLVMSSYYSHKNEGALRLFGLEDFSVRIDQKQFPENCKKLLRRITTEDKQIRKTIGDRLKELRLRKEEFIKIMNGIIY